MILLLFIAVLLGCMLGILLGSWLTAAAVADRAREDRRQLIDSLERAARE